MINLKELYRNENSEDPTLTRAKDLAFIYRTVTSEQEQKRDNLIAATALEEIKLEQHTKDLRKKILDMRVEADEMETLAERHGLVASAAESAVIRLAYPDPVIQGLGKLSVGILEQLHKDRKKIAKFKILTSDTDFGFFYHPTTHRLNVLTSQDNTARFAIGPGGMVGLTAFTEQLSDTQIAAIVLSGGRNSHSVSKRIFNTRSIPGNPTPYYEQGSMYDKVAHFDLNFTDPQQLPDMLGPEYDVLNEAVQQLVADSS